MYSRSLILCAAALLAVSAVVADDKPASDKSKAGLKPGNDLPGPFHPYNVTGKYEKKFHCLSDEHGLNPNVMIVVQNVSVGNDESFKPILSLLRDLDQYIVDRPKSRLNAFAVFLFNDLTNVVEKDELRAKYVDELTKINAEKPLRQVVLSLDSEGALKTAGYDIDPEWHVAVVLYDKLQVTKVYTAVDPAKLDVAAIMKEVKEKLAPFKK